MDSGLPNMDSGLPNMDSGLPGQFDIFCTGFLNKYFITHGPIFVSKYLIGKCFVDRSD